MEWDLLRKGSHGLWDEDKKANHIDGDPRLLSGGSALPKKQGNYVLPKVYPGQKIRCPNCGHWHGNESVLDLYRWCLRCCTVLQDPGTLYWDQPLGDGTLRVLAASYGHPDDARLAFDVRAALQVRVDSLGAADRLHIEKSEDITEWLGNPCPGTRKTLRIRYVPLTGAGKGIRREVWVHEEEGREGHLKEVLHLCVQDKSPLVLLFSASYGLPGGPSKGRGTFDVTEFMQGRVDLAGGEYLLVSRQESLTDLFGDPCPGRIKALVMHYEVLGTEGRVEALESDNHLLTPVNISSTPLLAPLLVVQSATYGQTQYGIDQRLKVVQKEISDLLSLQNRKDTGMAVTSDENKALLRLRPLINDLERLEQMQPLHFDVTRRIQQMVECMGGGVLELVAARDDLNRLFGNPNPGENKELRIRYLVVGHDSEQLTSLEETTSSGYQRNFILQQKGEVVVQAQDDQFGRGCMAEDVLVHSPKVLPIIEILSASYGHPRNPIKSFDICTQLRVMIDHQGGEMLQIQCSDDLSKLFEDPCRGVRKKIKINYIARGLNGHMRVNEEPDTKKLMSDVLIGYYSRTNFQESTLMARKGRANASKSPVNPTLNPYLCLGDDPDLEPLPLLGVSIGNSLGLQLSKSPSGYGGTKNLTPACRRAKKERRMAHQEWIRAELERTEKARKERIVAEEEREAGIARAVAEAAAAKISVKGRDKSLSISSMFGQRLGLGQRQGRDSPVSPTMGLVQTAEIVKAALGMVKRRVNTGALKQKGLGPQFHLTQGLGLQEVGAKGADRKKKHPQPDRYIEIHSPSQQTREKTGTGSGAEPKKTLDGEGKEKKEAYTKG